MLTAICPKLPMRNNLVTKNFYINQLGFSEIEDYGNYLLLEKDELELHFFEFTDLNIHENYGQIYIRTNDIDNLYQSFLDRQVKIPPNGTLQTKAWGQKEFALLDPDNNLLVFGQSI